MSEKYPHPFIQEDHLEATEHNIDVAHMLQMHMWGIEEIHESSSPDDPSHFASVGRVIEGVRTAVAYLAEDGRRTEKEAKVS